MSWSGRVWSRVDAVVGAPDLRSLAVFRIGLGVCVIADAVDRSLSPALYTADGLAPLAAVASAVQSAPLTHLGHATEGVVQATVVASILVGALIAFGAPLLRLWLAVALALAVSWGERNPFAAFAGDALLVACLWWSLGLPLRGALTFGGPRIDTMSAFAARGIMIQPVLLYTTAAIVKLHDADWRAGRALSFALEDPFDTREGAAWLLDLPTLTMLLTWVTIATQLVAPIVALVARPRARILAIGALAAFQVGSWSAMSIGTFPIVAIVAAVPLLPATAWPASLPMTTTRPGSRFVDAAFAVVFVVAVVSAFAAPLLQARPFPRLLHRVGLAQDWTMFEHPRSLPRGWFAIVAEAPERPPVNVLTGATMDGRRVANVADLLPFRERRFWTTYTTNPQLAPAAATLRWLCRFGAVVAPDVERVTVYFGDIGHSRDAGAVDGVEWQRIAVAECRAAPGTPPLPRQP